MFGKNSYLQQVSSSLQPRASTSIVDIDAADIFLHHHHHDILSEHYPVLNARTFLESSTLYNNQDVAGLDEDGFPTAGTFQGKQMVKKDRHSKIVTSQGPRDRRVRLSIGMARKFFDLQEMLGFDKPSKTLEWLLTKSKTAIKELMQAKTSTSTASVKNISSLSDECEVVSAGNDAHEALENCSGADSLTGKTLVPNEKCKRAGSSLAKESRAKARARARERTKEKMCIKKLNESRNISTDGYASNPNQYRNHLSDACKLSDSNSGSVLGCPLTNIAASASASDHHDLIQESILIKRMLKQPSFFGYQQNFVGSRDLNYGVPYNHTINDHNWDIGTLNEQSNLCDLLDQQKFINSSSNM